MTERSAIAAYFAGENVVMADANDADQGPALERLLSQTLAQKNAADLKAHIDIETLSNGLRINLTDTPDRSLFNSGDSRLNDDGTELTLTLGEILAEMPHTLRIEGHTDAFKTAPGSASNWAISAARANTALELLVRAGVAPDRFTGIAGLAATSPLIPTRPHAPVNRRISIVLELTG